MQNKEIAVDGEVMKQHALSVVDHLTTVANEHQRTYPPEIDLVYVFSGPGTYLDKLKPGQKAYQAFMDRDRLRAGVAVLRSVTASAKALAEISEEQIAAGNKFTGHEISQEDIIKYNKYFMYSGIPIENEVFRRARKTEAILKRIPISKTIIADEVRIPEGIVEVGHTGHQYMALLQEITNQNSPIQDISNVALVAHIPDFVRHPFYAQWLNEQLIAAHKKPLQYWFYGIRPRDGQMEIDGTMQSFAEIHTQGEISRLEPYAKSGSLATKGTPYQV